MRKLIPLSKPKNEDVSMREEKTFRRGPFLMFLRGVVIVLLSQVVFLICGGGLQTVGAKNVIHVPTDFSTIQQAVDAANPGDTIHVAPGTYFESVLITKSDLLLQASVAAGAKRVVLDGTGLDGIGIRVVGTISQPLSGVEIMGFVVQNFKEDGIVLENTMLSRVHLNEVRNNNERSIKLISAHFNNVSQNFAHNNLEGIILIDSSGNTVRGNLSQDHNFVIDSARFDCGIQLVNIIDGSNNNQIVENETLRNAWGILLGPGASVGNLVAQNRSHENLQAGIGVGTASSGNLIQQNNATGNGLANITPSFTFDLFDEGVFDNTWLNNMGTSNF